MHMYQVQCRWVDCSNLVESDCDLRHVESDCDLRHETSFDVLSADERIANKCRQEAAARMEVQGGNPAIAAAWTTGQTAA